jgi:hypothetical protein
MQACFRSREKGQNHRASTRQKLDPGLIDAQSRGAQSRANGKLSDGPNDDFGHGGCDTQPNRQQRRREGEPEPQRRESVDFGQIGILLVWACLPITPNSAGKRA